MDQKRAVQFRVHGGPKTKFQIEPASHEPNWSGKFGMQQNGRGGLPFPISPGHRPAKQGISQEWPSGFAPHFEAAGSKNEGLNSCSHLNLTAELSCYVYMAANHLTLHFCSPLLWRDGEQTWCLNMKVKCLPGPLIPGRWCSPFKGVAWETPRQLS